MQVVDDWLAAPPTRPPGLRAALDRLLQGPRSAWAAWAFGVVAPPILLWAERPVTWRYGVSALPLRPFTSLVAFAGVAALLLWRLRRGRAGGRTSALFAGALGAASCAAAGIGALLLPCSVPGLLLVGLGALGFVPFVTSWVCFGATVEAMRRALERTPLHHVVLLALLGGCVFLGGSWAGARLSLRLERRYVRQVVEHRESPRARPSLHVLWWFPGVTLDDLRAAHRDPAAAGALRDVTGFDPGDDPRNW